MAQKFAWLIVDLENGTVDGTNDTDLVDSLVDDDNYICINQGTHYFWGNRDPIEITTGNGEELEVDDEEDDNVTPNNPSEGVAP